MTHRSLNIRLVALIAVAALIGACAAPGGSESDAVLTAQAQSGDADAQYRLGRQSADAPFPDVPAAIYWLCLAAREGHVPAQVRLAQLYEDQGGSDRSEGRGRLSNLGSAYFWYTAAASQGSDLAFARRPVLEDLMDDSEVADVKRRATRWRQAGCVEPG